MANRNAVKEMLGLICVALLFPRSEKSPTPTGNTGYIIDTADAIKYDRPYAIRVGPITPPAATGPLPYLHSFLATILALLGDGVLEFIASYLCSKVPPLLMTILKRVIIFICIATLRGLGVRVRATDVNANNTPPPTNTIDESPRSPPPQPTTTPADDDDEWFDAETSQPAPENRPENAPALPTDTQAVIDLRAESAAKDAQIAALSRDAETKSDTIAMRDRQKNSLMSALRKALDPERLYPANTDVVTLASDIASDVKRLSGRVDRKKTELAEARRRQENGKLAENAREIERLSTENERLNGRIVRLEVGQRSSILEVERIEQSARVKERALRERTLAAESVSTRQAIDERTYNTLSSQFQTVAGELRQVKLERQQAIDARDALTTELHAERTRLQELRATADSEAEPQKQSESPTNTETSNLQLASDRVTTLEQEAVIKTQEAQDAVTRAETAETRRQEAEAKAATAETKAQAAETKAATAETKAATAETKAATAETKAQAAETKVQAAETKARRAEEHSRKSAEESSKTDGQLQQKVERAEKALSDSEASVTSVTAQLVAAQQGEKDGYRNGYQQAVEHCNVEGERLIKVAVLEEAQRAQQQLQTALAQREQDVRTSVNAYWQDRETKTQAQFNTNFETEVFRRVNNVQTQLNDATLRATKAETDTQDAEGKWGREWERANQEEARAKAAETELQKHKAGVARNTQPNAAEWEALENDRKRAIALNDEVVHRHYDFPARIVLDQLLKANAKIDSLKNLLKNPSRQPSQIQLLMVLLDAEVNETSISKLADVALNRQVILKQSKAVNAKLAALKTMINASEEPSKQKLLEEVLKPRGDEDATWCDDDPESEASSDEDEDVKIPTQRKREIRAPTLRLAKPEPPAPAPVQDTPSPSDPNAHKGLKRKGSPEDAEADAFFKERNERFEDTRPFVGLYSQFAQQGVLSSVTGAAPTRGSQHEMPLSEPIAEASAPRQQRDDQPDISTQQPPMPSSLPQPFNFANPAASSQTPSHERLPHNKFSKTTGPQKARFPASERQQRLRYKQVPGSEAGPAQEEATSSSTENPTAFSFSVPKSEASGISSHALKATVDRND